MSLAWGAQAGTVQPPMGDLRATRVSDLKPHPSSSSTYNEFWTYQLFLDGNVQAYLNFSRVNLGSFKAPVCGADFTLLGFKGRNWSVAREYEKKNFAFDEAQHRLQVHEQIWFQGRLPGEHQVHFATRKKDITYFLDLKFSEIGEGKVWGDGIFRFDDGDALGIFIHIPQAKVTGRLGINGDTVEITGRAYMDHTFQTALAPKLVGAGYRYISQSGPLEVGYYLVPRSGNGSKPAGYGLRESGGTLGLLKAESIKALEQGKALGVKVPTRLEIAFQDGTKSVLGRSQDRFQQSYLGEFSGFTKMGIKAFMGGEILTFRGLGALNGAQTMGYNYFVVSR